MGSSGVNSLVVKISDNSDSYLSEKTIKAPVTMPEKQLELSKRNAFFKDPFFQDMVGGMGDGLEKRLAEFSARSMGVAGAGLNEAAHNIQVSASNDKFMIQLELPGFAPEDFGLKTKDDKVQKTEDYVPPTTQTAEATVLLKVKEGDEYKLALNMQQYSPEDITIKLNGNELAIEAAGHGEQFKQKHIIPDNINLDAMSSSFSSDGVLVIKAPKK